MKASFIALATLILAPLCHADGVLVFGGTGQLGAYHVQLLSDAGERVAVFHRSTSSFDRLDGLSYERVEGDLMDADSVLAGVKQIKPRVIIDTSARRGNRMRNDKPFYAQAMRNIVAAAQAAGTQKIIIHSSVGVRDSAAPVKERFGYDTDSPNMRDKAEAEVVLEASGIDYIIIRNGLLEYEPAKPTDSGYLTTDESAFGRITRADLAALTLASIDDPRYRNKIVHALDDSLVGPRPPIDSDD